MSNTLVIKTENKTNPYFSSQILTYMGNKRKFLTIIEEIVKKIGKKEGKKLNIGEGFSGSGIVSRLFKNIANKLYVNDIAGYSYTLNKCFLSTPSKHDKKIIQDWINLANEYVEKPCDRIPSFIGKHWAPKKIRKIEKGERVYFTKENARRIDAYMYFIKNKVPEKSRCFLIAPLLIEASIHNNTNGNFSGFHKGEDNIGKFGGKNEIDTKRIKGKITLKMPVLSELKPNEIKINRGDCLEWANNLNDDMDLIYYDPPYNKHPYCIYYFLLDIIDTWDTKIEIPNTYRGQPKNWKKSPYNSFIKAKKEFENLLEITSKKSKYMLLSYNNGGIIPIKELNKIMNKYGSVEKIPIEHSIYNRMKGIASYKREKKDNKVKEFIWLLSFNSLKI